MRDELATVRCPRCRAELEYLVELYDTPGESERYEVERHIERQHADIVVEVRKDYLVGVSALPRRFHYPPARPADEPGASVWAEAGLWARDCLGESNLILYGGTGVGKTTLAARIARYAIDRESEDPLVWASISYWLHVGDFSRRARRLLATGKSGELAEIIDCAQQADFLFLDDLGAERPTQFVRDLVADLIEYRYDHRTYGSTVVTTNYSPDELAARLGGDDPMIGDRLVGRLCEDADQLHYPGRDRRLPELVADVEADAVSDVGSKDDAVDGITPSAVEDAA